MTLDVFDIKLGPDAVMPRLDADHLGLVAVQMLDAIQTVVDVLTDNDGGKGWSVTFDPGLEAYTDRSAKRHIVVSGKPLLDAKPGTPLTKVAAIMTGFAVHEVGHTKLDFYAAIVKRWPGKRLPITLGNIIEDVVLELRTVERYPGFADHGEGNVFRPTLEWVAKLTCPTTPLEWKGSSGHKVNVIGQIIRYRDFVTFANDEATQDALNFVESLAVGITSSLTPSGCVSIIEQLLDYMKATLDNEPKDDEPEPPDTGGCEFPTGTSTQSIPDEDDDTEGGDEPGEGGDEPGEDGDDTTEGGTEPGEDGDDDGGTEGGDDDGEGKDDGGKADGPARSGDGNDADHGARTEAPKGTNDGHGKGGSGQSISEARDEGDVDDGFDEADLDQSFDDLSKPEGSEQHRVARAEQEERVTTRMDAGAFGKMRVVWK